jgi:NAD(P)-dependent dehydrogenase (short-subunit alcohol dehydrogenase family)
MRIAVADVDADGAASVAKELGVGAFPLPLDVTSNAFLPQLRAHAPEAHVVNTASFGGLVAVPGFPIGPYVASK